MKKSRWLSSVILLSSSLVCALCLRLYSLAAQCVSMPLLIAYVCENVDLHSGDVRNNSGKRRKRVHITDNSGDVRTGQWRFERDDCVVIA